MRQDALIAGVAAMNETLGTHSEMLAVIMEVATQEPSGELSNTLKAMLATLREQSERLVLIGRLLSQTGAALSAEP
jgi:hypothetical protein